MSKIKNGVILTGGTGSRLYPLTSTINKHLLNINGKFIIDYPLQTLKNIGVENLNVVLGGNHFEQIVEYLKDGSDFGFNVNYIYQKEPKGISQAINLCRRHLLDQDDFVCILGDNIYQYPFSFKKEKSKAKIILNDHPELNRFGVATIDAKKRIVKIEEKPIYINKDNDNYAVTGCYFFDQAFFEYFNQTQPSSRGEFEITSIMNLYHSAGNLNYTIADGWWIDAGTFSSINDITFLLSKAQTKTCAKCNNIKSIDDFYTDNGKLKSICKECDTTLRKVGH